MTSPNPIAPTEITARLILALWTDFRPHTSTELEAIADTSARSVNRHLNALIAHHLAESHRSREAIYLGCWPVDVKLTAANRDYYARLGTFLDMVRDDDGTPPSGEAFIEAFLTELAQRRRPPSPIHPAGRKRKGRGR